MDYVIETRNLVKSYKGKSAVDGVNIHVKKGEIYGFAGPNGAGKSTVMKMLLNLTQPDSGEVLLWDEKIEDGSFECLKRIGSASSAEQPASKNPSSNRPISSRWPPTLSPSNPPG